MRSRRARRGSRSWRPQNKQLRRAVSDLTLEKLILKEAASGGFIFVFSKFFEA